MAYTWATVPMVTQYDKAGTASLEQFRQHYNRRVSSDKKLTMTAILLKICAAALKNFPNFNSSLDARSNELILKRYIHIGVAVDTPNGLLVPVLRNVDEKGIESLAAELNDIAERTRERKITPAELEGEPLPSVTWEVSEEPLLPHWCTLPRSQFSVFRELKPSLSGMVLSLCRN